MSRAACVLVLSLLTGPALAAQALRHVALVDGEIRQAPGIKSCAAPVRAIATAR